MRKHVSVAIICLASNAAAAGTIYKCVDAGRISYHDRPCGDTAVALSVQAAAAAPEALQRLARERALLQEIEDTRADQEKRAQQEARASARAQQAAAAQRRRCDKLRLQRRWADEDSARAGHLKPEAAERARTKARRQAEALAVECPA